MEFRNYLESLTIGDLKERMRWFDTFNNYLTRAYKPMLDAATEEQYTKAWNRDEGTEDLQKAIAFYECENYYYNLTGWLEKEIIDRVKGTTNYVPRHVPNEEEITTLWYEEYPDANPQSAEELLDIIGIVYSSEVMYYQAIEAAENVLLAHQHYQEERERWFTMQQEYAENFN
jgi:hypothetical protein